LPGREWASTIKGLRLPADSPKRAALCAIIPGLGAVYNTEYLKAVAYFTVWAALAAMGNRVSSVFGFGAFVFVLFTMFDAYRSAEARVRNRLKTSAFADEPPQQDKTLVGWGVFLMILGLIFFLHNIIPFYFLNRFWPLLFILIGAFLVYRALQSRKSKSSDWSSPPPPPPLVKEDL
jgi:4-hydroxybenzoate polyprenyltransferase